MEKKMLIYVMVFCVFALSGCAGLRQLAVDVSAEEVKNAEATREIAKNYLAIWPIQSGFIRAALGPRIDELPEHVVAAMDELDDLTINREGPAEYSDYDLGTSLGLRVRMLVSVVAETIKFYAPEIVEQVPFLF